MPRKKKEVTEVEAVKEEVKDEAVEKELETAEPVSIIVDEEEVEEVVPDADADDSQSTEEEVEKEIAREKKVEAVSKTSKPPLIPQEKNSPNEKPVNIFDNERVGLDTDDSGIRVKTALDIESEHWRDVVQNVRRKGIVWSEVIGVEVASTTDTKNLHIICSIFGFRCVVPESEFWMPYYNFGKSYESKNPSTQLDIRVNHAKSYIGATVPLILTHATRKRKYDVDEFGEQVMYFEYGILGSRLQGMNTVADVYFTHSLKKSAQKSVRQVVDKDICKNAHVLSVRNGEILVEAFGVETKIRRFETMGYPGVEYVESCKDAYNPGDKCRVRIFGIYYKTFGGKEYPRYQASIRSAMTQVSKKAYDAIAIKGCYAGTIAKVTKNQDYAVLLKVGVYCFVRKDQTVGYRKYYTGDKVTVQITEKKESWAYGFIM